MIVLDENLVHLRPDTVIAKWYPGRVCYITELRSKTVIKDEAMPTLLLQAKAPTFVTTNVIDFWKKIAAHRRYCILCLPLPNERLFELPKLLQSLFRLSVFKTKNSRMGRVARINRAQIQYYAVGSSEIRLLNWNTRAK